MLTLAGVLAVSAIAKVRSRMSFRAFAEAIAELRVAPMRWSRPVAMASIAAEISVLALLLWPGSTIVGLAAAVLLFGAFTVVLARAVRRGSTAGCHCFGPTNTPVAWRHVVRSAFLASAAAGALIGTITLPAISPRSLEPPHLILALSLAGFIVATLVRLDDLTWLLRGASPAR
ncbi:MauE/DoxX family redox-associated membrane protein [Micromonospora sp. NPDC050276]|uniref:MauE/DoxX family redox-associated membrane protein n=1 Tax=Micromonospora sp. NPDC050276 TaxID=3364278 RepID=UPI0037B7BD63